MLLHLERFSGPQPKQWASIQVVPQTVAGFGHEVKAAGNWSIGFIPLYSFSPLEDLIHTASKHRETAAVTQQLQISNKTVTNQYQNT